jgi:hypothetical protein
MVGFSLLPPAFDETVIEDTTVIGNCGVVKGNHDSSDRLAQSPNLGGTDPCEFN